jgi:hypothetical protein
MAEYTPEERMQLRRMIGDVTEPYAYNDDQIDEWLTATDGDARSAASTFWYAKATSYSEMVDISEAGSSRKNGDLFKNAMQLAKSFDDNDGENDPEVILPSTTRRIVRR